MKMLTVLHTESSTGWGGQESRSLRESRELIRRGHRAIILCQPKSGLAKRAEKSGIPFAVVRMRSNVDPTAINFVRRLVRKENIDIINTHSSHDSWIATIGAWFSGRKPVIIRTRHLAIGIKKSLTYTLLPDKIVAVSEYVRRLFLEKGIEPDKVVTIPSGIDIRKFDPAKSGTTLREEIGINSSVPVIVMVAILRVRKGHYYFVHAAKKVIEEFSNAMFLIVGDGPQRTNIERYINELDLKDNVLMLGLREDIPRILASADLYVIPSLSEGMGQSTMEAMAMGVPVIASDVGGLPELIIDDQTGILVPPKNILSLAKAITGLLSDKEKSKRLAAQAKQSVIYCCSIERTVDKTLNLYSQLLK
jgi:glycosyltransferase involved in cell wall biosynthesis